MVSEYAALTPGRRATREVSTLTSHARLVHVLPGNAAPKSAGRYAAYNRRDCFRATARTKVNTLSARCRQGPLLSLAFFGLPNYPRESHLPSA